jgi:hypothetical protein
MTTSRTDHGMENTTSSDSTAKGSEALYAQLQADLAAKRWIEAVATCYRILHAEPDYRDVSQLLEEARKQLALDREPSRIAGETRRRTAMPAVARPRPGRRRWPSWLLIPGLAIIMAGVALAAVLMHPWRSLQGTMAGPTVDSATMSPQTTTAGMTYYVNSDGRFLLKYPEGWVTEESPPEGQSLRIVFIIPETKAQPARIAIFFAPGGGQSADQVWISVLGLVQATQDENTEDWLLGEATSTSIGGYHARQMPFRYRHTPSEVDWRGLIVGLAYNSTNYAFVVEAPAAHWPQAWPLFEEVLNSIQFQ